MNAIVANVTQALGHLLPRSDERPAANPWPLIGWGMGVLLVTFVGFGAWATNVELARGAHVPGKVIADSHRKMVQHQEGGIVGEILAREGESVEQGQILVRLDQIGFQSNREILLSRYIEDAVLQSRLEAELTDRESFVPPADLPKDDVRVGAVVANQEALLSARRKEILGQLTILRERVKQLALQIEGAEAQQTSNQRQLQLIQDELVGLRQLAEGGLVPLTRLRSVEREEARLIGEDGARTSEIAKIRVMIGETELQIAQTDQNYRRQILDDLKSVRTRLAETREQLLNSEDILRRGYIRAPIKGQVIGLAVHTVGGVVAPGSTLMAIAPADEKYVIEAQVSPMDADVVAAGQHAEIRFPSLPKRTTPLIHGSVQSVSKDTISEPQTGKQYYLARIEIKPEMVAKIERLNIVAGMPAEVLIKAGERTLLDYLVSPWVDLFSKAMREE